MEEGMEEQKRKILRFLGERFKESPDDIFSDKAIAKYCDVNETEVKKICYFLEEEGLIQNKRSSRNPSYKITTNGLILLESYSTGSTPGAGIALSQFKEFVKHTLDKIHVMDAEVQEGVIEVGKKHNLKDGLFYVALIDLAGSTIASSKMSGAEFNDWIKKFIGITRDALNIKKRNLGVFVKSIGDASLFLFRNFYDVLDWKNKVDELCSQHNEICKKEGKLHLYQYYHKTIIHLSEVYFDRTNSDTNAFGVHLVFKVEKRFGKNEIGITETVKQIILQEINAGKFRINNADSYSLDESGEYKIPLWKLTPM